MADGAQSITNAAQQEFGDGLVRLMCWSIGCFSSPTKTKCIIEDPTYAIFSKSSEF